MTPGLLRAGPLLFVALVVMGAGACTFERRDDVDEEEAAATRALPGFEDGSRWRSPEGVVRLFREAVVLGDLSMALSLLDRQSILVDELAGAPDEAMTRGELLLELRRRHTEGLVLEVLQTRVEEAGETALVLTHLAIMDRDEDGIGVEVGRVYESVVLVPTEEGWRIRHLHRSVTRRDS